MSLAMTPSGFTCSRTDWFALPAASRLGGRVVLGAAPWGTREHV